MEQYGVTAFSLASHSDILLTIEADEAETTENIVLSIKINDSIISASNDGYFQAFQEIRDKLLEEGYGLKCVGAMLNVVQSSMASATDKVYIVTLGKQSVRENLTSLYEYANIVEFPNTDEQNKFAEKWIHSLG